MNRLCYFVTIATELQSLKNRTLSHSYKGLHPSQVIIEVDWLITSLQARKQDLLEVTFR